MKMYCNTLEVLRLREELISRMSETSILTKVYLAQCKLANKSVRIDHPD